MHLLEIVTQSIRGFSPSVRVAVVRGYVVLRSPTDIPAPLISVLESLFYGDVGGAGQSLLASRAQSGRIGIGFQSSDASDFRLVREIGGPGRLQRRNAQSTQYEMVAEGVVAISAALISFEAVPQHETFKRLFTLASSDFPSKRNSVATTAHGASGASSTSDRASRQRLVQLEAERSAALEAERLHAEADTVQAELEAAKRALSGLSSAIEAQNMLKARCDSAPTPASLGLPDDIILRLQRHDVEQGRLRQTLEKLDAEITDAAAQGTSAPPPLWRDVLFVASAVVGIILLFAATWFGGQIRFLSLTAIPAFTFAALLSLRHIEQLQMADRRNSTYRLLEAKKQKIEGELQAAASVVQDALHRSGVRTISDFESAMNMRSQLEAELTVAAQRIESLESDPTVTLARDSITTLERRLSALSAELSVQAVSYARDTNEIDREIAQLQMGSISTVAPPAALSKVGVDLSPLLIHTAATICSTDVATMWGILRDRVSQYLVALSGRKLESVDVDGEGLAAVAVEGKIVRASELQPRDADLLYLSLRLSLIEKIGAQVKVPFVLEDTLSGLISPPQQALFARMLKNLGGIVQVLHVTGVGYTPVDADVVVTL